MDLLLLRSCSLLLAAGLLFGAACSDDVEPPKPDIGTQDSALTDTAQADTLTTQDSALTDTAQADTLTTKDSTLTDTAQADTLTTKDSQPQADQVVTNKDGAAKDLAPSPDTAKVYNDLGTCTPSTFEAEDTTTVTQSPGHWSVVSDSTLHGGQGLKAGFANSGGKLTFSFVGKSLKVYHSTDPTWFKFGVRINGGMTVLYSSGGAAGSQKGTDVTSALGLSFGKHSVELTDQSNASGQANLIDYFEVGCN